MSTYLSTELRHRLLEVDNRHCAYCHTDQSMTINHIIPQGKRIVVVFE